jgi:hypothetical protein
VLFEVQNLNYYVLFRQISWFEEFENSMTLKFTPLFTKACTRIYAESVQLVHSFWICRTQVHVNIFTKCLDLSHLFVIKCGAKIVLRFILTHKGLLGVYIFSDFRLHDMSQLTKTITRSSNIFLHKVDYITITYYSFKETNTTYPRKPPTIWII